MAKFGIDVSKWQGEFNFSKAKNEDKVEFVILRGAYAQSKDKKFDEYYAKCKGLGLPVGVYHYSMATTIAEAKAEAKFLCEKVLKGKKFELPIYMDVEDKVQLSLGKSTLTEIVKAWCEYLETKGYYVGIYASTWTFQGELDDSQLKKYTHWIAQWSKNCTYSGDIDMWQFGGETNSLRSNLIAGQVVDQDYMYEDFPSIIKAKGLNGFGKKQNTTTATVPTRKYFAKTTYTGVSLVEGLSSVGAAVTFAYRKKIATANGVKAYLGTASQNTKLLNLLKQGKLIKP